MTEAEVSREFDAVCRQLHVEPGEMRFGRTRRRTARLATAARALFILRTWKRGATGAQIADALELSKSSIKQWVREMRSRGLLADRPPQGRSALVPEEEETAVLPVPPQAREGET